MIIHDVEQGTEAWHNLRAGIPTASEFSKLVTSTGKVSKSMSEYAMVLAAEKFAGKMVDGFTGNMYTERGKELEDEARADYEMTMQQPVVEVGIVTNDLIQYAASPDGMVGENGMVEFKCKIAKEHIKTILYFEKHGKAPTDYIAQTQGQMFVCERDWVDLMFYHPELPNLIIRQTPNPVFIETLKAQLKAVEAERNIVLKKLQSM